MNHTSPQKPRRSSEISKKKDDLYQSGFTPGVSYGLAKIHKALVLVITCLFVKFRKNLPCSSEISKLQKINEVNFPQISRINMRFLFNHMWQALKDHTRVRITQKESVNINKFNMHNFITPTLQWLMWLFVVIIIIIIIINN